MPHQSLDGASYFIIFIDYSTQKVWAYRFRTKDRVFSIFSNWLAMVENKTSQKLKCLRTLLGKKHEPMISLFHPYIRRGEICKGLLIILLGLINLIYIRGIHESYFSFYLFFTSFICILLSSSPKPQWFPPDSRNDPEPKGTTTCIEYYGKFSPGDIIWSCP